MSSNINIHWFRQDLRIFDNPSLCHAARCGEVLPIYILDDENAGNSKIGGAGRLWLHHALRDLNASLDGQLRVYQGKAEEVLRDLVEGHTINGVFWNRCYEPWRIDRDRKIKDILSKKGVGVESFNASLLWEPWEVLKKDGTPYKVFTPYYRKGCLQATLPRAPLETPQDMKFVQGNFGDQSLAALNLLPDIRWDKKMLQHWDITEHGAWDTLSDFLDQGVYDYKEGRNIPAQKNVSRLSPYLHWGQISPHQVWHAVQSAGDNQDIDCFCSELGWREFSYSLLYHFPDLPWKNLQGKFDQFPWIENEDYLKAWQRGQTGYPIIDAGMRELWQTGYMHNRVRMIVGSFLVKNLLLHWHHGEAWFWDCLFDADLANNSASWQWIAGCGADAAPYFRIFNPVTQGERFDTDGAYTRHFVPELKDMPDKYLFKPWEAPEAILKVAGVTLGEDYPKPIVDIKASRALALEAFSSIKN